MSTNALISRSWIFSKFRNSPSDYAGLDIANTPMFGNVLEIGSGNGLLITSFIQNIAWFDRFIAIDPSINAINCTLRASTGQRTNKNQRVGEGKGTYICARFDPDLFSVKFDVVICNPPYIPMPPAHASYQGPFLEAVGGVDLLKQVLQSLPRLLSERGILFLVCSSLADKEFQENLPPEIAVELLGSPIGMEVPFDVESVLNNETWLNWLVENRDLVRRGDVYYHRIKCYALHLQAEAGFEDTWKLLQRIRQMNTTLATTNIAQHDEVQNISSEITVSSSTPIRTDPTEQSIMLRFRNLSGTGVDTVTEHRRIEDTLGYVWWGWWKRQIEINPRDLFRDLSRRARQGKDGEEQPLIYMFDTGSGLLYSARLLQIASQPSHSIPCPEPNAVPLYYRGQEHAAWFKITSIRVEPIDKLGSFIYSGFPTLTTSSGLLGKNIGGWEELGQSLVTLWLIGIP